MSYRKRLLYGLLAAAVSVGQVSAQQTTSHVVTAPQLPLNSAGSLTDEGIRTGRVPPHGTTQERSLSPSAGEWRYNDTIACTEVYSPTSATGFRCTQLAFGGTFNVATNGSTGVQNLGAVLIPGGVMGRYGCLHITLGYGRGAVTSTSTFQANLSSTRGDTSGGTGILNTTTASSSNLSLVTPRVICNSGVEGTQLPISPANSQSGSGFGAVAATSAIDTSQPFYLNVNAGQGVSGAPDAVTLIVARAFVTVP